MSAPTTASIAPMVTSASNAPSANKVMRKYGLKQWRNARYLKAVWNLNQSGFQANDALLRACLDHAERNSVQKMMKSLEALGLVYPLLKTVNQGTAWMLTPLGLKCRAEILKAEKHDPRLSSGYLVLTDGNEPKDEVVEPAW